MRPLISVGVPVFRGEHLEQTLRCIQSQIYDNLEILISIDAGDEDSLAKCRPFLKDERIAVSCRSSRLGWAGNTNWLIDRSSGEYFCFFQQDDLADDLYFAKLEERLRQDRKACLAYSNLRWFGKVSGYVIEEPLVGDIFSRLTTHIKQMGWVPMQGLVRLSAIRQAGLIRVTEFDSCLEEQVWLTRLACVGSFTHVPEFLYYKRNHSSATHRSWHAWPPEQRMNAWISCIAGIAEVALANESSRSDRLALMSLIFSRLVEETAQTWSLFEFHDFTDDELGAVITYFYQRLLHSGIDLAADLGGSWRQLASAVVEGRERRPG